MPSEQLFELRRRTFDTPEFRGMEFIEVEAKSVINRVPGNFLPFSWTINPYRGCSHSCSYCTDGDTEVLMADGRTKLMADVKAGDEIYGTMEGGTYRHFVRTRVLAHWSTVRPAFRTTLEDGTQLITSGDHRFLTDRGWKHVTGSEHGACRRPHLTHSNKLLGTGAFATPPEHNEEYRRGYVCGMIRGDGTIASRDYRRRSGATWTHHFFRLAVVDLEALERTRVYLGGFHVYAKEFEFQKAVGERRALGAIRTQQASAIETITRLIAWPELPGRDWQRGFLAGIFDAEGSHSECLRFANTDSAIIDMICTCLRTFGFAFRVETTSSRNGLRNVRLLGGTREILRFLHTVDPAITRKHSIQGRAIKNDAPLRVVAVEPLGIDLPLYDITTGTGDYVANGVVHHNCFARVTHTYLDMDAGRDFETKIVVKVNAPEVLRRELAAKRWKGEHIAMGTGTDPYQRAEGRYKLMRGIMDALIDYRNPFSILTKGTLITRDLDVLQEAASVTDVSTSFSIGTLDEDAWRTSEPGTPHPRSRIDAVRKLNEAGIPCGVLVAPVLPGITDSRKQLREVVRAAIDAGATHVSPILLHLRPVVREEYMKWLADEYPDLVERMETTYTKPYAPTADRKALSKTVGELIREAGGLKPANRTKRLAPRFKREEPQRARPARPGEQLSLM